MECPFDYHGKQSWMLYNLSFIYSNILNAEHTYKLYINCTVLEFKISNLNCGGEGGEISLYRTMRVDERCSNVRLGEQRVLNGRTFSSRSKNCHLVKLYLSVIERRTRPSIILNHFKGTPL